MRIGYACLALNAPGTQLKSCMQRNATQEKLQSIIESNLNALMNLMRYNHQNSISLFRISSDIIPFGSSPVNALPWWEIYAEKLKEIGAYARLANIRLSMHPGQYTVLNSPKLTVVKNAILDLDYHARLLDSLQAGPECKIILHVGGVYQNKAEALKRFESHYQSLSESVKRRLVLENDDKAFCIDDVLMLADQLHLPVIFDNLHNAVLPSGIQKADADWVRFCSATWKEWDGPQKIHYSQQDVSKRPGAHSATIDVPAFLQFVNNLHSREIDIMLEVKDKNLSAVQCIQALRQVKYTEV